MRRVRGLVGAAALLLVIAGCATTRAHGPARAAKPAAAAAPASLQVTRTTATTQSLHPCKCHWFDEHQLALLERAHRKSAKKR